MLNNDLRPLFPQQLSKTRGYIDVSAAGFLWYRRWRDSLYSLYFLNEWLSFYQTCMEILSGQAKGLTTFWRLCLYL